MRRSRFVNSVETIPARSRVLIPAAMACGLLWLGTVFAAGNDVRGSTLVLLGAGGLLVTVLLLLLIQRQHTRLRNLAATDPLTGLVNHRGFHEALASSSRPAPSSVAQSPWSPSISTTSRRSTTPTGIPTATRSCARSAPRCAGRCAPATPRPGSAVRSSR